MERAAIVGLGNPGALYAPTRHNVGFRVLSELCRRAGVRLAPGKGEYYTGETRGAPVPMLLIAPTTYMNNSGVAVADAVGRYGVPLDRLLVVVDDLALPLGEVRFRRRGSDGGHNGLASVIMALNTEEFPRLRCGIRQERPPREGTMADFVLAPFDDAEEPAVSDMILRAADAAEQFAVTGESRPVNPPRDAGPAVPEHL